MNYAADDTFAIKARMAEIAKTERSLVNRLLELYGADLDAFGVQVDLARRDDEPDYSYRVRLRSHAGLI